MTFKHPVLLVLLCILLSGAAYGQCPYNIDFETGTTTGWVYYKGHINAGPVYAFDDSGAAVAGWHTLTSGADTDYYGGFPVVTPGGGAYSLKLGHDTISACAQKARYYVHVPAGTSEYSLIYHFAVVLENPGHPASQQPRMSVTAYDSATLAVVPCASYNFVADASVPGFIPSFVTSRTGGTADVNYKRWTTGNLKFPGCAGKTIIVDFVAAGCSATGHFGYGYLDMNCGLIANTTNFCVGGGSTDLAGPDGYSAYHWYDSATFSTSYGTTQAVTVTVPSVTTTYALVLTPYSGYGCADTLYTRLKIMPPMSISVSGDTVGLYDSTVRMWATTTDSTGPFTYRWSPSTGLSCTTCDTVTASLAHAAPSYTVTVTDGNGCSKDTVLPVAAVVAALGTNSAIMPASFSIAPNPNHGSFSLTLFSGISENAHMVITNIVGEKVQEMDISTNHKAEIKLNSPAGVYFISATTSVGRYMTRIVIE